MTLRLVLPLTLALAALAAPAAVAADDIVERGRTVFMKNGCHGCHTIGAMGSAIGPDLSRVGFKYRAEYIERWLRDPSFLRPSAHMPALELTDADIQILARYLATLR
jgi:cytochrome c oxidase subunit II